MVVDQAQSIENVSGLQSLERTLDICYGTQRIPSSSYNHWSADLIEGTFRSVTLPTLTSDVPKRGQIRSGIAPEPTEASALAIVDELIADGAQHALLPSEDRAADVGDYLTMHGFIAGAPGNTSVPVWLGIDAPRHAQGLKAGGIGRHKL